MSALKFITLVQGRQVVASGLTSSAGVADANKLIATNAQGKLDPTLLPAGVGVQTIAVLASENLSPGDFVNIYNNGGTPNVRKASATNGYEAHGYVLDAATASTNATVYLSGNNGQRTGLTGGSVYYLGDGGGVQLGVDIPANPSANYVIQNLGVALNTTTIAFEYNEGIVVQ